jgi:hypothetical protein
VGKAATKSQAQARLGRHTRSNRGSEGGEEQLYSCHAQPLGRIVPRRTRGRFPGTDVGDEIGAVAGQIANIQEAGNEFCHQPTRGQTRDSAVQSGHGRALPPGEDGEGFEADQKDLAAREKRDQQEKKTALIQMQGLHLPSSPGGPGPTVTLTCVLPVGEARHGGARLARPTIYFGRLLQWAYTAHARARTSGGVVWVVCGASLRTNMIAETG